MNPLQLVMIAINGLSVLTNNPLIGGGSNLKLQEASKLLSLLGELVTRGEEGYEELKAFAATIEAMVEENRAPTPEEWAALKARSDAAHDVIQEARRRAEAELAEEEEEEELDLTELTDEELDALAETHGVDTDEAEDREELEALVAAAIAASKEE